MHSTRAHITLRGLDHLMRSWLDTVDESISDSTDARTGARPTNGAHPDVVRTLVITGEAGTDALDPLLCMLSHASQPVMMPVPNGRSTLIQMRSRLSVRM